MTDKWVYQDYILKDQNFVERQKTHNQRYVKNIRESDQHLIRIVCELLGRKSAEADQLQLLDVGCNTGNLLLHLRAAYPEMQLSGVDISDDTSLEEELEAIKKLLEDDEDELQSSESSSQTSGDSANATTEGGDDDDDDEW